MINSLTYLTRRCPRKCGYCSLRDAKDVGKELTPEQWIKAFDILQQMNVHFNLILGNETWLLGYDLLIILERNQVPYAMYTTCPEPYFSRNKQTFFESGIIDNLSCGIDYPINLPEDHVGRKDDSYKKSVAARNGMIWAKQKYPHLDVHGTITIHKLNCEYVLDIVNDLTAHDIFIAVNFIHWNKDGEYDFFPEAKYIQELLFTEEDIPKVTQLLQELSERPGFTQNPGIFKIEPHKIMTMDWHCGGDPYGGPTIDSDGRLRCCGYRKGRYTPNYSIFDLPEYVKEWREAVRMDAMECPGCAWTYPMGYHYWNDSGLHKEGIASFVKHQDTHIPKEKWSNRKLQ